jgi:hypothetical protein
MSEFIAYRNTLKAIDYVLAGLIERIEETPEGFATLILRDGLALRTAEKPFAILERIRARAGSGSRADAAPADSPATFDHIEARSITVKHPDSDAMITLTSTPFATGLWVQSATSGTRPFAAVFIQDSQPVIQLFDPSRRLGDGRAAAQFAVSLPAGKPAEFELARQDGSLVTITADRLAAAVALVPPEPA